MDDPVLDEDRIKYLTISLEMVMMDPVSVLFREAVPLDQYPEYNDLVPLPIDLSMILARVKNGYYRNLDAIFRDIEQIMVNCAIFNQKGSSILGDCKQVEESALEKVKRAKMTTNMNPCLRSLEKEFARFKEQLERERLQEEEMEKQAAAGGHAGRRGRPRKSKAGVKYHEEATEEYDGDEEVEFADSGWDEKPSALGTRRSARRGGPPRMFRTHDEPAKVLTGSGRIVVKPQRYEEVVERSERPRRAAAARRRPYQEVDEDDEEDEGGAGRIQGMTRSGRISVKPQKFEEEATPPSSRTRRMEGGYMGRSVPNQQQRRPGLFGLQVRG